MEKLNNVKNMDKPKRKSQFSKHLNFCAKNAKNCTFWFKVEFCAKIQIFLHEKVWKFQKNETVTIWLIAKEKEVWKYKDIEVRAA